MAKHHYLPAAFIGRFSDQTVGPMRDRMIWVNNSMAGKIMQTTPSGIGFKRGLYNLSDGRDIDHWQYEANLGHVLDDIAQGHDISLDDYIRVAVPFVAGLFVRGREFNQRFEGMPMIKHLKENDLLNADNTNISRSIRLQRLLAPVASAHWKILHNQPGQPPLVSNDIGLVPTKNLETGDIGWAIPLDTRTILGIFPCKKRRIADFTSHQWRVQMDHLSPNPAIFVGFHEQLAKSANEFVFGPTRQSVAAVAAGHSKQPEDLAIIMEGAWNDLFSGADLRKHEFEWHYLAAIANKNVSPHADEMYVFQLEDVGLTKWSPPILMLSGDDPKTGISFEGNELYLDLD